MIAATILILRRVRRGANGGFAACVARRARYAVVIAIALYAPVPLEGQPIPEARIHAAVDSVLQLQIGSGGPGAGVVVVRDGRTVFEGGRGLASVEHRVPIGPDTRFHLYSGSKQFTAWAITLLEVEGRLSLDDEVRDYLPDFPDFGVPITIRHLLHHTSGIRQQTTLHSYTVAVEAEVLNQERALQLIWAQRGLNFPPGTNFGYSDSGYAILSRIIEEVVDRPFQEWMVENVFRPHGMSRTLIVSDFQTVVSDLAFPYAPTSDGVIKGTALLSSFYGGTGVYSTPRDLGRWLALLASPEAADMLVRMEERGVLVDGRTIPLARGLFVDEPGGVRRVWHGGDGHGYKMWIGRYPELGLGIAVLGNSENLASEILAQSIAEALDPRARGTDLPPSPNADLVQLSAKGLETFVGLYRIEGPTILETPERWRVQVEDGRLRVNPNGRGARTLLALSDSVFGFPRIPVELTFHQGEDGAVDSVRVSDPSGSWSGEFLGKADYEMSRDTMLGLEGKYRSNELGTSWRFEVREGVPTMVHDEPAANRRRDPIPLVPVGPDRFVAFSNRFWIVDFVRDATGDVRGLLAASSWGKLTGLRFELVGN